MPPGLRELVHRHVVGWPYARTVHHELEPAECRHDRIERALHGVRVTDIRRHRDGSHALLLEFTDHRIRVGATAPVEDAHMRAKGREEPGGGGADAATAAGDERTPPLEGEGCRNRAR